MSHLWLLCFLVVNYHLLICAEISEQDGRSSCNALPWLHQCEPNGYDKMIPPEMALRGETTPVKIQIYIESIGSFKAGTMDYDLDIYFVQFWDDPRLKHNFSSHLSFNSRQHLDRLWLPDIYFANSKKAEYNYVTVPNNVLKLQPNGSIRFSMRLHMKIACHMDLQAYPIDSQRCYLKIVTYGSTNDKVNVTWTTSEAPIILNPEITDSDLQVVAARPDYCNGSYFDMEFSCLLAVFNLKRNIAYSLLQIYLPTTFIVIISWMSFWIDPNSVPGRVGLAVTTLLTLSTHAIGLHYHLPPVSYAKAQDVWLGACILFLFAALVEFALVNMYTRRGEQMAERLRAAGWKKRRSVANKDAWVRDMENGHNGTPRGSLVQAEDVCLVDETSAQYKQKAVRIDAVSRIIFPIGFTLFCILYWFVYLLVIAKQLT